MKYTGVAILSMVSGYLFVFVLGVGQDADVARQKKLLNRSVGDGIVRTPAPMAVQSSGSNTQPQAERPSVSVPSDSSFAKSTEALVVKFTNAGNIAVISAQNLKGFGVPYDTQESLSSLDKGAPNRAKEIVRSFQLAFAQNNKRSPLIGVMLTNQSLHLTFRKIAAWNNRKSHLLQTLRQLFYTIEIRDDTIVVPAGRNLGTSPPASKWKQKSDVHREVARIRP